jgi:hypothetical protein
MDMSLNRRSALVGGLATGALLSAAPARSAQEPPTQFYSLLRADGPHPSLGSHADTFGRLIGDWHGEYFIIPPDKPRFDGSMEFHIGWVLGGRAVQDVFIFSQPGVPLTGRVSTETASTFGSTIKFFDTSAGNWKVRWIDPTNNQIEALIANRVGDDIIQTGMSSTGKVTEWNFTNITPTSFLWRNHQLDADGKSWLLREEYRLRRM